MSKKLSRARRRELREQGLLEPPARVAQAAKIAERRAEEAAATRPRAAREPAATRAEEEEGEAPAAEAAKAGPRRDRTVLVLIGITALAALIFWLTQRSPTKETKIDVPPPLTPATGTAKP